MDFTKFFLFFKIGVWMTFCGYQIHRKLPSDFYLQKIIIYLIFDKK